MTRAIVVVADESLEPPPPIHRDYLSRCLRRGVWRFDAAVGEAS